MEQKEIVERSREIARSVVASEVEVCDKNYIWHEKGIRAMQGAGLAGLVVDPRYGGLGRGLRGLAEICEVLGYESASMGISFGMHCVGSAVIGAKPTEHQIENYLKPIASGSHITTLSLSEPGSGAHFYYPQTTLLSSNGQFVVNGEKTFTTNGGHADSYVLSVVDASNEAPIGHFSCILVDKDMKGLSWGEPWKGMGMRGNSSLGLKLANTIVPRENLLGTEGDQIWYIFNIVAPYFLIAMAGTYLGLAQSAFDEAQAHLKKRSYDHSGASLSESSVLQHKLGRLWSKIESSRRLVYWAADEGDSGGAQAIQALCSAKAEMARSAVHAVNESMTMCGGIGYRNGSKLERLLRDVRAADVMAPTTDLLYTWIGRLLLDQPILN